MRRKKLNNEQLAALGVIFYILIGFLTGAFRFNENYYSPYRVDVGFGSVLAGVAWPIYWIGRGSLWITSGAKPEQQEIEK